MVAFYGEYDGGRALGCNHLFASLSDKFLKLGFEEVGIWGVLGDYVSNWGILGVGNLGSREFEE